MNKITIYHNVHRECGICHAPVFEVNENRDEYAHAAPERPYHVPGNVRAPGFTGYQPEHELTRVFEYDVPDGDAMEAAHTAFQAFNAPPEYLSPELAELELAYRARYLRSLSVGDVVQVDAIKLACAPVGWVQLAGELNVTDRDVHGSHPLEEAS